MAYNIFREDEVLRLSPGLAAITLPCNVYFLEYGNASKKENNQA